jgi:predicted MFS family arabinose efflux permease
MFLVGPSLNDLQNQNGVHPQDMSWVFLSQGIGMVLGIVTLAFDYVARVDDLLLLGISLLTGMIASAVIGFCTIYLITNIAFFFQGIAIGLIEVG